MKTTQIMIVAGEASGDQHAADLIRALREKIPAIRVFGLGGSQMTAAGAEVVFDLVKHAVIGFSEAVRKLGDFIQALRVAEKMLRERRPDVLVLVDFPDLNFRIAAKAKALGIPVAYYISPQVWAWRRGRVKTLRRLVDRMIVVFPFEEPIYQKAGVPVTFVGHPLLDTVQPETDPSAVRKTLLGGRSGPLIALLPGSRAQEIDMLLPIMTEIAAKIRRRYPQAVFFIPLARTISRARVEAILTEAKCDATLVTQDALASRAAADLAVVASGTATLETAILGVPMLIVYRMRPLSHWLARWFVKLPYFGLANLAAGEKIAPEFLQGAYQAEPVAKAALHLLSDPAAADVQRQGWNRARKRLGGHGAAVRAADAVLGLLR